MDITVCLTAHHAHSSACLFSSCHHPVIPLSPWSVFASGINVSFIGVVFVPSPLPLTYLCQLALSSSLYQWWPSVSNWLIGIWLWEEEKRDILCHWLRMWEWKDYMGSTLLLYSDSRGSKTTPIILELRRFQREMSSRGNHGKKCKGLRHLPPPPLPSFPSLSLPIAPLPLHYQAPLSRPSDLCTGNHLWEASLVQIGINSGRLTLHSVSSLWSRQGRSPAIVLDHASTFIPVPPVPLDRPYPLILYWYFIPSDYRIFPLRTFHLFTTLWSHPAPFPFDDHSPSFEHWTFPPLTFPRWFPDPQLVLSPHPSSLSPHASPSSFPRWEILQNVRTEWVCSSVRGEKGWIHTSRRDIPSSSSSSSSSGHLKLRIFFLYSFFPPLLLPSLLRGFEWTQLLLFGGVQSWANLCRQSRVGWGPSRPWGSPSPLPSPLSSLWLLPEPPRFLTPAHSHSCSRSRTY